MAPTQVGYDFWTNVLGSPKFVAAPMVDMSELAFRLLCRQHNAQLCYSPMFHSQQFSQDFLYRKDNFSTCAEDRPLIVQFCANDPNTFVEAASLVTSQCDAVDLNLGCPQAIAKKGNYGAFLQEDWDLIHSIVRKAASDLPVPITGKMRVLPGHVRKTVEYAQMLEKAGCSVIAVHGRTREQKGHATGLASWDIIKEIKAQVKIPVIANGNILCFENIEECLEYTGVDAVMSAEALLHNPALFSAKNPPVWSIVEEYLKIAEKYSTPVKCVRCHLFKILYLCIHQDEKISQILADASKITDFYSVCDILKKMPSKVNSNKINQKKEVLSIDEMFNEFNLNFDDFSTENYIEADQTDRNLRTNEYINDYFNNENNVASKSETFNSENLNKDYNSEHLPVWLCHSRPRVGDNEESRGCYSQYFTLLRDKSGEEMYISKKKLRRERHHERVLAGMKEKRKVKKMRRKLKIAEMQQSQPEEIKDSNTEKLTKKQQKILIRERLLSAQSTAPKVCINLGFTASMVKKELTQLAGQLRRLYGSNRHSMNPLHLYFCNFDPNDKLFQICMAKNDGFSSYVVDMTSEEPEDLFKCEDLIYLSPDSDNVLESLDINKVYVIGGIVDGTVKKDLSLNHAKVSNAQTARLPISEYLVRCSVNPGTTVLTVNQVFDILLHYYETKDWVKALSTNVPIRKGYCAPSSVENEGCSTSENKSDEYEINVNNEAL